MPRPFTVVRCEQGDPEWWDARLGRLTGSRASDMLATVSSGEAAGRRNLRVQLVCERLTSIEQGPDFFSPWMERGHDRELDALSRFEAVTGQVLRYSGFLSHDTLMAGCSLDGHLGDFEEIVEVKVPKPAVHLGYVRAEGRIPGQYLAQIRHNVWISGAERAHFVSYGPDFPQEIELHVVTFTRDELEIPKYEDAALRFLEEVDEEFEEVSELCASIRNEREAALLDPDPSLTREELGLLSEKQIEQIVNVGKKAGHTAEQIDDFCMASFNESIDNVSAARYEALFRFAAAELEAARK